MLSYTTLLAAFLAAASPAAAHMQLSSPFPLRSPLDPANGGNNVDYSMTNPLSSDGSDFPCKGYHKDSGFRATATYAAGSSQAISLAGSATHSGGSCQISLSYDRGATFTVIHSMLGGCPLVSNYPFTVPADAPGGEALLAWSWFNLTGNREMYMNCAQVEVTNALEGPEDAGRFSERPKMFAANVGGQCRTAEGKHTVFAEPGKSVVYGSGVTANTPAFPIC